MVLSSQPRLSLAQPVPVVGLDTPVKVKVQGAHGFRRLDAHLEQGGARYPVFHTENAANRFLFWRRRQTPKEIQFRAGKNQAQALKDGKAKLIIEAQSNDFLGRRQTISSDVEVVTSPPRIAADGFQHYINQGGSELATFTVSGNWSEAGARVGKYTFRSFPLPGKPNDQRFSLFAYPWDLSPDIAPIVYARNQAGTEARGHFWYKLFPKKFRTRDLELTDAFLQKVVDQIDPNGSGDLLNRFLNINGELRHKNNQTLADLRVRTEPRFLWTGPFLQLANSKVESQFADVRSYIYRGKKVDQQVHLGFDLSVTQHIPVVAANDGKVVYASDLGIYGNCIVVDHGYGLQSIYGHLSQIGVKIGDMVKKGQEMGKSGSTGLAGGDHLHFSMQVDGVQVNPVEWWDDHWIQDRIRSKL